MDNLVTQVTSNPHYKELVSKRKIFSNTLAAVMLLTYYLFILVVAFMPEVLGIPISDNSVTSVGLLIGVGIILFSFILTGIYTFRANSEFDTLAQKVKDEIRDNS